MNGLRPCHMARYPGVNAWARESKALEKT